MRKPDFWKNAEFPTVPGEAGLEAVTLRRVMRNGATLILAKIITKLATAFLMVVVARLLGDSQFGTFSSILAYTTLFGLIEEWGLTIPLIRRVAAGGKEPGALIGEALSIKLFLSIPALIGLLLVGNLVGAAPLVVCIFGFSMVMEVLNVSITRSFEGLEKMRIVATILIIERTVLCLGGLFVWVLNGSLVTLSFVYLTTNAVSLLVAVLFWKKEQNPIRLSFSWVRAREYLREAFPFAIAAIFSVVYNRIDIFFLSANRISAEVGWYTAAFRVTEAQMFIPIALVASIFPVLSRSFNAGTGEFIALYRKSFYMLSAIGLLLALFTCFFATQIIGILYGDNYPNAIAPLNILSLAVPLYFLNVLVGSSLIAINREKFSTITLAIGALVNTILNAVMVPSHGQLGSAMAKVITEVVAFIAQIIFLHMFIPVSGTYRFDSNRFSTRWMKNRA